RPLLLGYGNRPGASVTRTDACAQPASCPTLTSPMSFADVGYDEAMARAGSLITVLRERAAGAEALRQMAKETEADLHRSGLFRFHQPRRWGGMELPFVALFDIPSEIGRGCASTAWNVANLAVHHWLLAHRMCLVPKGDYEIVDDWQVLGMRSTGSKSVRATDVFVPEHRALCMYLARGGSDFPGAGVNPAALYRVPIGAISSHCLAAAGVGNAQAALELTVEAV